MLAEKAVFAGEGRGGVLARLEADDGHFVVLVGFAVEVLDASVVVEVFLEYVDVIVVPGEVLHEDLVLVFVRDGRARHVRARVVRPLVVRLNRRLRLEARRLLRLLLLCLLRLLLLLRHRRLLDVGRLLLRVGLVRQELRLHGLLRRRHRAVLGHHLPYSVVRVFHEVRRLLRGRRRLRDQRAHHLLLLLQLQLHLLLWRQLLVLL